MVATEPAFSHNRTLNRWAEYDAGQAAICCCLQATALGLTSQQMGGFDIAGMKQALDCPDQVLLMSVIAIGHAGDVATLDESFLATEESPRSRKSLAEITYNNPSG